MREDLAAERGSAERLKSEQEALTRQLREKLEDREESFREVSKRLKWVEESALQNSRPGQGPDAGEEAQQLRREVQRLEEENLGLRETGRAQNGELVAELERVKAELAKRVSHSRVNNSVFDGDDLALLMVENENLKKEIKVLKNDSLKQNEKDKMAKRAQEKEAEIAILRDRNGELEAEAVG